MQEATLHVLDMPILGLTLEEGNDGLSELTIDLKAAVPAEALAKLLSSLAELYNIGYAAAGKPDIGFITFDSGKGGKDFVSSEELFIAKLEIGTPNKVKVTGASSVLDDLYKIMKILTLAVALVAVPSQTGRGEAGPGQSQTHVQQTVEVNQQTPPPENPVATILDLHKALNENIQTKMNLDKALANREMSLHSYLEQTARLNTQYKQLSEAMKVTTVRLGS